MKSIVLQVSNHYSNHAGFWSLFQGFFRAQAFQGITNDTAQPQDNSKDICFFEREEELEQYIRSFRE